MRQKESPRTMIKVPLSMFYDIRTVAIQKGIRLQEATIEAISAYLEKNHEFIKKEISLSP